jgi:hypothetical protein
VGSRVRWVVGAGVGGAVGGAESFDAGAEVGGFIEVLKRSLRKSILHYMLLCMRTTVDLPDSLAERIKACLAKRKMTFRGLVIAALEQALRDDPAPFKLRDASVGGGQRKVSNDEINTEMDAQREPAFRT